MRTKIRTIILSIIMLIILPHMAMAVEFISIHGVEINLKNGEVLKGYIETYLFVNSCDESKEIIRKWNSD